MADSAVAITAGSGTNATPRPVRAPARASGLFARVDDEQTRQERIEREAALAAREAAEAEAYRRANPKHYELVASSGDLHITKKRSHKLLSRRALNAGHRWVLVRPTAAKLVRGHLFQADAGALALAGSEATLIHSSAAENFARAQAQLKRLKDDNEAITLLLLAA